MEMQDHTLVIFEGFHLVSPGPIEGSPCMWFGLLEVVPMGGYMARFSVGYDF